MRNEAGWQVKLKGKITVREILLSVLTYVALSVELKVVVNNSFLNNIIQSFGVFRTDHLFLFPAFLFLYSYIGEVCHPTLREGKAQAFLAGLLSLFMIFGYSFQTENSWALVTLVRNGQLVKSAIVFAGYFILFFYLIHFAFYLLDRCGKPSPRGNLPAGRTPRLVRWYLRSLRDRTFLTVFLTLLAVSVPNIIISYPARFMGDTHPQILQAFSELHTTGFDYLPAKRILKEGVYINQHHPVVHTLLIHVCLLLGDAVFGSLNPGLFLFGLLQTVILISAYAYACSVMVRKTGQPTAGVLMTVLYAIVHPMISDYLFLVTKDTIYAALILVFLVQLFEILSGETGVKRIIPAALSIVGIILFRNEGRFILYLVLPIVILLHRPARKQLVSLFLGTVLFSACVFHLVFPALGYTPGSRREMLSVPFQQTARYIRDYPDEVTEAEKETINKVLNYETITKSYLPYISDPVKNTFKEKASGENLKAYFRVWWQMFLKHPRSYIQTTMNNYYQYFYPGNTRINFYPSGRTDEYIIIVNSKLAEIGKEFSRPRNMLRFRVWYDRLIEAAEKIPFLDVLSTPAYYSWMLFVLLFWAVKRKNRNAVCLILLPVIMLAFCLVGPCNGYYGRYQFPVIFAAPLIIRMMVCLVKAGGSDQKTE